MWSPVPYKHMDTPLTGFLHLRFRYHGAVNKLKFQSKNKADEGSAYWTDWWGITGWKESSSQDVKHVSPQTSSHKRRILLLSRASTFSLCPDSHIPQLSSSLQKTHLLPWTPEVSPSNNSENSALSAMYHRHFYIHLVLSTTVISLKIYGWLGSFR